MDAFGLMLEQFWFLNGACFEPVLNTALMVQYCICWISLW